MSLMRFLFKVFYFVLFNEDKKKIKINWSTRAARIHLYTTYYVGILLSYTYIFMYAHTHRF